jgi:predicted nucleic acid-binding protein
VASRPNRLYWDTGVFIEYFTNDPASPYLDAIKELHTRAKRGEFQICTSVISISEAAFISPAEFRNGLFVGGHEEDLDEMWADYPAILCVNLDPQIAQQARAMKRWAVTKHIGRVDPDDLLHMATALYLKVGAVHTLEKKWFPYHEFLQRSIGYPEAPTSGPPRLIPEAPKVPVLGAGNAGESEIIEAEQ